MFYFLFFSLFSSFKRGNDLHPHARQFIFNFAPLPLATCHIHTHARKTHIEDTHWRRLSQAGLLCYPLYFWPFRSIRRSSTFQHFFLLLHLSVLFCSYDVVLSCCGSGQVRAPMPSSAHSPTRSIFHFLLCSFWSEWHTHTHNTLAHSHDSNRWVRGAIMFGGKVHFNIWETQWDICILIENVFSVHSR